MINKIYKPLARLVKKKKKKERTQINKIRNEKENLWTYNHTAEISKSVLLATICQ